jgi:hypothetical protein
MSSAKPWLTDPQYGGMSEKAAEASWRAAQEQKPSSAWRDKIVGAKTLQTMVFEPARYILPGYIVEGATIIAGKPKVGKSWLTLDIAIAATANRFTLGTLKPTQGDVLYLALEDNPRRLQRRMSKVWPDGRPSDRLALVTDWRRADEGGLEHIDEWCASVADPVMVIVDTLEKFRPMQNSKANAYSADYAAVTGLQKIAGNRRIAVVINHHVRKMDADDPFDTVSGTLGLTGAADSIIVLKRHAGAVTLHARGRDIEELETAIQFERATCRWTILGAAAEVHLSRERAAVIAALTEAGSEGLTVSEIMAHTGNTNRNAMDALLFRMRKDVEIERPKKGVYCLPQDQSKMRKIVRNDDQTTDIIDQKAPSYSSYASYSDLTPSISEPEKCTHCRAPGELTDCAVGDVVGRVHPACGDAWRACLDFPEDGSIPPILRRTGEAATKGA